MAKKYVSKNYELSPKLIGEAPSAINFASSSDVNMIHNLSNFSYNSNSLLKSNFKRNAIRGLYLSHKMSGRLLDASVIKAQLRDNSLKQVVDAVKSPVDLETKNFKMISQEIEEYLHSQKSTNEIIKDSQITSKRPSVINRQSQKSMHKTSDSQPYSQVLSS